MKDRDFLRWIIDRLICVHGEDEYVDYMWKLRSIAVATPDDRETPNIGSYTHSRISEHANSNNSP